MWAAKREKEEAEQEYELEEVEEEEEEERPLHGCVSTALCVGQWHTTDAGITEWQAAFIV